MTSAKEIKKYAVENNISNGEARKALIDKKVVGEGIDVKSEAGITIKNNDVMQQVRALGRSDATIAIGLVVEKHSSSKPEFSLPKLKKNSSYFRVDVNLSEIEAMAATARASMPGITMDDIVFIIGDGLKENAHLENGEQFAAILCTYLTGTDVYRIIKDGVDDEKCKGVIIRIIPYKDGYIIRPSDYIRSYDDVDMSFKKMRIK